MRLCSEVCLHEFSHCCPDLEAAGDSSEMRHSPRAAAIHLEMSMPFCVGREGSFGHGLLNISADGKTMSWSWNRNLDGVAVVTDSVTFVRDTTACPTRGAQFFGACLPGKPANAQLIHTVHHAIRQCRADPVMRALLCACHVSFACSIKWREMLIMVPS